MKLLVWVRHKLFIGALWCVGGAVSHIVGLYLNVLITEVVLQ